jgi:mannitol/fructose-specific phosphotransferase system IIA component (Ntr-type)
MKLSKVFTQKCTLMKVKGMGKSEIIKELVDVLVEADYFKPTQKSHVIKAVAEREAIGSTGIGEGVAIPHAKVKFLKEFHGALGIIPDGVDWKATDGNPVSFVFLFTSPEDRSDDHQLLIRAIVSFTRLPHFLTFLGKTKTPKEVQGLFREAESMI